MSGCKRCSICCRVMPLRMEQVGFDKKWVEGRGGIIVGTHIYIPSPCKWITEGNVCSIQDEKPEWCKKFPTQIGPQPWLINMGCKFFD